MKDKLLMKIDSLTDNDKLMIYDYAYYYEINNGKLTYIQSKLDEKAFSHATPTAKENAELMFQILDIMKDARCVYTLSEVSDKIFERMSQTYSFPKISFLLEKLVKSDVLVEIKKNRASYYRCNKAGLTKMLKEFSWFKSIYANLDKDTFENIDVIIDKLNATYEVNDMDYDASDIQNNKEKLIEYLKSLANLDSDLYSLKKRYQNLGRERSKIMDEYYYENLRAYEIVDLGQEQIKKEITSLTEKINNKPVLNQEINVLLPEEPVRPIFELKTPQKPILKEPGFFNKKKIEEENRRLKEQYKEEMVNYNKLYEKYTERLNKYYLAMEKYKKNVEKIEEDARKLNKERYDRALIEFEKQSNKWKDALEEKNNELTELSILSEEKVKEILCASNIYKQFMAIEYEMKFIIENIKKIIKLEKELYSYNIIYGKYRNIIAISSFLDYLLSGRCETLDTKDGAYNIYEQEARTDIIINKMDTIIKSLSQIKNTQYYIYNQLNMANNSLDAISDKLLVNNALQAIEVAQLSDNLEKLDIIAYNSEVTAFYTKKNANYTKALAFLNLIK